MIETFPNIIAFTVMGLLLALGATLRARIVLFQYGLVPASLIGGVIGLSAFTLLDIPAVKEMNFASFTFHFFTLSFISLCLTRGEKPKQNEPGLVQGGTWLSSIWISSLIIQAFIGLIVILGYNALMGTDLSPFLGIIATHGFTQGPGQALALGSIWEQNFNVENVVTVGLIYASAGFIASFAVGVPVARWAIKKGLTTNSAAKLDEEFTRGFYDQTTNEPAGRHVTHPANVDTLAWHLSILGVVYLLTHIWIVNLGIWIGDGVFFGANIKLIASHNLFFVHGMFIALIVRWLLNVTGLGHIIDNNMQKRITGTSVDFMMVGMLLSIQVSALATLLAPILLVTLFVTLTTAALCFGLGRQLANYKIERALTSFGTCTGSTGSALLLLRIVDPDLTTPVSKELAFFNVAVTLGTFHIWGVFAPILPSLSASIAIGVYLATLIVIGFVFMQLNIRKSRNDQA